MTTITHNQITFTRIGEGKWQANLDGIRISGATIIGGSGCWAIRGQRSAETLARFSTRMGAAKYQLMCAKAEQTTN